MSIWTSRSRYLDLAAALTGAALLIHGGTVRASISRPEAPRGAQSSVSVLDDTVVIPAPDGYCIDPLASIATDFRAFVLMVACGAVSGADELAAYEAAGFLTASVDGSGGGRFSSVKELQDFLGSPKGIAALSRSGDPSSLTLGHSYERGGAYFLQTREAGGTGPMGARSWRAVFQINGRMITATLRELDGEPIRTRDGFRTVERLVERIREESPSTAEFAEP